MTMRLAAYLVVILGVGACAPAVPESGPAFSDYNSYMADREAQLRGTAQAPFPGAAGAQPGFDPARVGAAIDAAEQGTTLAPGGAPVAPIPAPQDNAYGAMIGGGGMRAPDLPLAADRPRGNAPAGIAEQSGEMIHNNLGISDEQDFGAVSARETIESDKQRIERNRAQYTVIEPTALPERSSEGGPNIVQFAVNTRNAVGEQLYSRSAIRLTSASAACGRFKSPDLAQEAFLKAGGPQRDPKRLDPDGDGFACAWDPRPFRTALQ